MFQIFEVIFWLVLVLIIYSFAGYPLILMLLDKILKPKQHVKIYDDKPKVSIIVPAHNEEDVIKDKLNNLSQLDYPYNKVQIIIASDNSNDETNNIVMNFINNSDKNIKLYEVKERKGKTNAQNEAVRVATGEFLIFTDANSMLDKDAVTELAAAFTEKDIMYVAGQLVYVNQLDNITSNSEATYWSYEMKLRDIESRLQAITAGNGAVYAIRAKDYIDLPLIKSHDAGIPLESALRHKRSIFNKRAIAYEKAGETSGDEFNRKVRMFRSILDTIFRKPQKYNVFKHKWFSFFYFSHRTLRASSFLLHIVLLISNIYLSVFSGLYSVVLIFHISFYVLALLSRVFQSNNKLFYFPYYYTMTLMAQLTGAYKQLTGKSKPFWEKAESTR
ncbi:glycosyltransferase family 2 protein [Salisediminibacterium halotolerans]|uniref:Glycosyltransferase, catalytic subunit of cellulose synthase and poly-beta-1,6-N-acetylglucosamine synthase n=1 Tax=Salisediminibacterium halotolerans TaxID=517425 RepID=A0A1H9QHJ4_9BACI|nr:glycosyltransferase family 2 protein [Salisediminibacterium haloalkalitolerans]SER59908.1 Glycosyltransferase, catalytic subunit of cellulose synthase and poly-beta-1,6-N-acetylglucosamine synthase [Salisediminibacterium haloalkalitolerans]